MKQILKIVLVVFQLSCAHFVLADVEIIPLASKVFKNTRNLRVYLPPDYSVGTQRYPVLYLTDGIATFHAYRLEEVVDSLILGNIITPLIIVGIDNGGSTNESTSPVRDRANEYLPWSDLAETDEQNINASPEGKKFQHFLFEEVIPIINKKYRTKPGSKNITLGGASYGALISLYTATVNPKKMGRLLLESPSLYVHNQQVFKEKLSRIRGMKIYVGIGTKEGDSKTIQQMAVNDCRRLVDTLSERNPLHYELTPNADHSFDSFAKRFPIALRYLFNAKL